MIDKLYDKPTLFSIRYAMHIELVKFLRLSTTLVGAKKIKQIQPIKTLSFSKNDHYGINNMHYIQHGNQDNIYLNLDYTSNLETFVSENLSSIDFITVGTHSSNENEDEYGRISYICVLYSLCLQKQDENLILKLFNVDTPLSIGIIALLASMYKEVHIVKPETSYGHLSEVFIVCKYFVPQNSYSFYKTLVDTIRDIPDTIDNSHEIFDSDVVNLMLLNRINEIATFFFQRQLENIHTIINSSAITDSSIPKSVYWNKNKIHITVRNNIEKCVKWICHHYSSRQYDQSEIIALMDIITTNPTSCRNILDIIC
jgi:23S rRNA U2552 (ribose-2'-O)-methylase RlmE/FtsJ